LIGVGVIGCGYWGPNVIRNFAAREDAQLRTICDLDPARLETLTRRHPTLRAVTDHRELLDDPRIDAVAICTPVHTHYELAMAALDAGKHVMVEKPLTDRVETARRLVAEAEARGLVLLVDHTFVYAGAVRKIRSLIDSGELGDLLYVDSVRINLGLFQSDVSVVWDLAAHDVSIMAHLIDRDPISVSAIGRTHYGELETQAYVTIDYGEPLIGHAHVNWLAPLKIRSTVIGGSKRMVVYDDLAPSEKIRVYDKGVTLSSPPAARSQALVDYRMGDMFAPHLDRTEPLARVCACFLDAVANGVELPTDGRAGLAVVRVLEAAQESIRKEGERIPLEAAP